jgi:hypothetical protein
MNLIVPCGQETLLADKSTSIPTSVTSGSGRMEELRVYKLSGGMMLRVFH